MTSNLPPGTCEGDPFAPWNRPTEEEVLDCMYENDSYGYALEMAVRAIDLDFCYLVEHNISIDDVFPDGRYDEIVIEHANWCAQNDKEQFEAYTKLLGEE